MKRDTRIVALACTAGAVIAGGAVLAWIGTVAGRPVEQRVAFESSLAAPRADRQGLAEIRQRFDQGVVMLHAKQYEHALTAFHRVLELAPDMPEAHVNMGFALIGLKRFAAARDFFEAAIALRANQANAYYGLALALKALKDLPGAIGAMKTFLHLGRADDQYVRKGQAALREWQGALDGRAGNRG